MIATNDGIGIPKQIQDIVDSYCDFQGILFTQKRELVIALFERAGIKSPKQFDETKSFIKLAYTGNFIKTKFYQEIVHEEIQYNDIVLRTDKDFYEVGLSLTRGLKKRKQSQSGIFNHAI